MDFDFGDLFHKLMPSLIGKIKQAVLGPFSWLLSIFDPEGKTDKAFDEAVVKPLEEKANPDFSLAKKTIAANLGLEAVFAPIAKTAALKTASAASNLQKIASDEALAFLADGIPPLDQYGKATAAVSTAMNVHRKIIAYLCGDGEKDIGLLAAEEPNTSKEQRIAKAQAIASAISGLPAETDAGFDLAALATTPPKGGVVGMLSTVQTTVNAKDFKAGSLTVSSIPYTLDLKTLTASIAALQVPAPRGTAPKDVASTTTPTVTSTKTNSQTPLL